MLYEYKNRENKYAIGSVEKDRYIEVNENSVMPILQAIQFLNGKNSYKDIETFVHDKTGSELDVKKLCEILQKAALIENGDKSKVEKSEYDLLSLKLFEISIKKLAIFFDVLSKVIMPFVILLIISLIAVVFYCNIFDNLNVVSLFGFKDNYLYNIFILFIIMAISLFFHELAHGIVAAKYGLHPESMTISLYLYISPIVYLKIPGLYTVKPRQRIAVWSAGVLVNLFFFCVGIVFYTLFNNLSVSTYIISFFQYLWYVNLLLITTNLFPLLPLDGYFILATLFKIPNLRKKSFGNIKNFIKTKEIKLKGIYLVYFILSAVIMCSMVGREFVAMFQLFEQGLGLGILNAFWSIKQYLILIILIIIVRIHANMLYKKGKAE